MLIDEKQITLKDGRKLLLRSPVAEDAQAVLTNLILTFKESYRNMNMKADAWEAMTVEEEAKILRGVAESDSQFMIAAFSGERIVGMLGIWGGGKGFTRHNGKLGMSMQREFQGAGLGSQLMQTAVAFAEKSEVLHRIELTVRTFNEAGIRLYESSGFRRVGELKECALVDGEFVDEFMYELVLKKLNSERNLGV
ncbi:MAG: N-acetyltransferase [Proteobacteria bacterium]|nr:MAG: N-acetyltransferase [Pseudomonadota bacterium]